jgi:serine beta-lactamase-like protein LACTB, mitochondrial
VFKPKLALLLLLLTAVELHAQCVLHTFVAPPPEFADAAKQAQAVLCEQLVPHVPGAEVAVGINGRLVWSAGIGDVRETTRIRIGSISKPIAADVFALLVQQGKLDPDAPIDRYVPNLPEALRPITSRQLAGHLGGIRHYKGDEFLLNKHYATVRQGLEIFENDPLVAPPGTKYAYSTYGFSLLSAALEGAAHRDFPTLLRTMVFEPLKMTHTKLDDGSAPGFEADDNSDKFHRSPPVDNSYKWAGGGVLSTADDLVKFESAHLKTGRMTQPSLDLLFTSMKTAEGKETNYGAGWDTRMDDRGHKLVGHNGSAVGGTSRMMLDRDSGIAVVLLTNITNNDRVSKALRATFPVIQKAFDK